MAGVLITAALIAAAITGGGVVWLILDRIYLITKEVVGPIGDITETIKTPAGKIGVAGAGLILLGLGIAAVLGAFKKIRK